MLAIFFQHQNSTSPLSSPLSPDPSCRNSYLTGSVTRRHAHPVSGDWFWDIYLFRRHTGVLELHRRRVETLHPFLSLIRPPLLRRPPSPPETAVTATGVYRVFSLPFGVAFVLLAPPLLPFSARGYRGAMSFYRVAGSRRIRVGSWNETKWKGSRAREVNGYKLWYSGFGTTRNGVGVMVAERLKDDVVRVARRSNRIMAISIVINGDAVNVISAYASQVRLSDVEKRRFWDALDELWRLGYGDRNEEEVYDLQFATAHEDGGSKAHILMRRNARNCRAFPGETCSSRHRLIIVAVLFERKQHRREREATGRPRILWKNLKGEEVETFRATMSEKLSALEDDMYAHNADQMWNTFACVIRDVAKDSLGVASKVARTHSTHRDSWWFCEEVQTKVATKQARFKELLSCQDGNQEDIDLAKERYKVAKREAKIVVDRAKDRAYEDLRDIGNVRYIKDEGGRTIVREEDIRKRWGEYFSSLFNESPHIESRPERSGEVGSSRHQMNYDCYYSRINQGEVKTALHMMGRNKVIGPDQIPIEAWRCLEDEGVKWLTCLFNNIFLSAKMPEEWRLSEVIPIYKNKGDAQACSNYRGIKLLSHTMNL
ncbi:retrovirus-related pol polyprotein LINE-1 [Tanacetum coccineum]